MIGDTTPFLLKTQASAICDGVLPLLGRQSDSKASGLAMDLIFVLFLLCFCFAFVLFLFCFCFVCFCFVFVFGVEAYCFLASSTTRSTITKSSGR